MVMSALDHQWTNHPGQKARFVSTPMRRTRSLCCARAANGHATAAPPRSLMKLRRCMWPPRLVSEPSTSRLGSELRNCRPECPLWVKSRQTVTGRNLALSAVVQKWTWDNDFGSSIFGFDCYKVVSRYGSVNALKCKIAHSFNHSNGEKARPPDVEHNF